MNNNMLKQIIETTETLILEFGEAGAARIVSNPIRVDDETEIKIVIQRKGFDPGIGK